MMGLGVNRINRVGLSLTPAPPVEEAGSDYNLLLEDGDDFLLEDDSFLLLEDAA